MKGRFDSFERTYNTVLKASDALEAIGDEVLMCTHLSGCDQEKLREKLEEIKAEVIKAIYYQVVGFCVCHRTDEGESNG